MRTSTIGTLTVSAVGLGCNNFGRALDQAGSARVTRAALDAGVTFFDTASNYGRGQSEQFLGAGLGKRRAEVVIATKVGQEIPGIAGSGGAKPEYLRRIFERSLAALGTDYIDLFMLHWPDPDTPIEDTLATMNDLVDEGKVREIGCSNLNADQLDEALDVSADNGWASFVCDQVHYSMVHRQPETDGVMDNCVRRNVALLPYYPLASGLLTGKTRRGQPPKGRLKMNRYQKFLTDENFDVVERLEEFTRARDLTMVQVALGWLLAHDVVPAVTAGATSPEQVAANVRAADWTPTREDLDELEGLLAPVP